MLFLVVMLALYLQNRPQSPSPYQPPITPSNTSSDAAPKSGPAIVTEPRRLSAEVINVRIMPYRTLDDRIDGAVITFADITVAKTLEARLRSQQASLEKRIVLQTSPSKARRKK